LFYVILIEFQTGFQTNPISKKLNNMFLGYLYLKIGYASVSTMTLVVKIWMSILIVFWKEKYIVVA